MSAPGRTRSFASARAKEKPGYVRNVAGFCVWSRRQESNLDLSLRRAEFYPLKYGEKVAPSSAANPAL